MKRRTPVQPVAGKRGWRCSAPSVRSSTRRDAGRRGVGGGHQQELGAAHGVTLEQLGFVHQAPANAALQLTPRVMRIGYNYLAANPVITTWPTISRAHQRDDRDQLPHRGRRAGDGLRGAIHQRAVRASACHRQPHHPMYCTASGHCCNSTHCRTARRWSCYARRRVAIPPPSPTRRPSQLS